MTDESLLRVAADLGVAMTSVERRYSLYLRDRERDGHSVVLNSTEKALIAGERSFLTAHRALRLAGLDCEYADFERAVWRDGGDRALAGLRQRERASRHARRRSEATTTIERWRIAA